MTNLTPCLQHLPMQRTGLRCLCSRSSSLRPTASRSLFATRALDGSAAAGTQVLALSTSCLGLVAVQLST